MFTASSWRARDGTERRLIEDSILKEYSQMPVILVKAGMMDKALVVTSSTAYLQDSRAIQSMESRPAAPSSRQA